MRTEHASEVATRLAQPSEGLTPPESGQVVPAFIGGEFKLADDEQTFTTVAPSTGMPLAEVTSCGDRDVDDAVRAARSTFEAGTWSRMAPADRKATLLRFAELIEQRTHDIALLDALDAGKPITDCRDIDLPDVVVGVRWFAEAIDKVFGKVSPSGPDHLGLIVRQSIGVVGAVLPWNFPAAMLAWKMAPALAAGCSLVIKPAEQSPLSTVLMAELAAEAGIPDGVFNVVPGLGHTAGRAIGLHADVDAVTFTGSTEIGRKFLEYSAQSNLKRIVLECGGKSPQIVMADAASMLDVVAEDLADAAFWNAGQNCTAGSRILVDNAVKDDFINLLSQVAAGRVVGDPLDAATQMGPLIEFEAKQRVLSYISEAADAGARIRSGGSSVLDESGGYYVAPTVLDQVTPDMAVAREEIFGPVVCVMGFDEVEEAHALANDTPYGLAATVWTKDINVAFRTASALRAGTVAVNGYSEGDITTPFGGHRQSGFGGRDKGLEALEQYTELKTIWVTLR